MILIFEGPDNVGKDTIIQKCKESFSLEGGTVVEYHCCTPPKFLNDEDDIRHFQDWEFLRIANSILELASCDNVILNHSWICEYVYGQMYRNRNAEDVKKTIKTVENMLLHCANKYLIHLTANEKFVCRNDDGNSLSENKLENVKREIELFKEAVSISSIKSMTINVEENGEWRKVEDIMQQIRNFTNIK